MMLLLARIRLASARVLSWKTELAIVRFWPDSFRALPDSSGSSL